MSIRIPRCLPLCGVLVLSSLLVACGGGGQPAAPPVVAAKLGGESVLQASTVFDTTGTSDPAGGALTLSWDYGDGSSGSASSHVYTRTGSFNAVLTARNAAGASSSATLALTVAKCSLAGTSAAALSPYPTVCMQTSSGEMVLEVYPTQAPLTTANFLKYVGDGFYAGTLFHRVVKDFVIQGGGFTTGLVAKPPTYAAIPLESNNGLKNWQYTLAMARTNVANSATSQFFVNLLANSFLDYNPALGTANGYAVFGQVISGTAVVDAIGLVATSTQSGFDNVPVQDVVIRSAVRMP